MIPTFQLIEETLEHIHNSSRYYSDDDRISQHVVAIPSPMIPSDRTDTGIIPFSESSIVESMSTLPGLVMSSPSAMPREKLIRLDELDLDQSTSTSPPRASIVVHPPPTTSADEIARNVLRQLDQDIAQFRTASSRPGRSTGVAFAQECSDRYIQHTLVRTGFLISTRRQQTQSYSSDEPEVEITTHSFC